MLKGSIEIINDLQILGGYTYVNPISKDYDSVGDVRESASGGDIVKEKCTVANAIKGGGTWVVIPGGGGSGGGSGDVTGPAGATDGNVALFDGATGKIIKDGGTLGDVAFKDEADLDHNSITNTHTIPPQAGDAADTIVDDDTIPFLQFVGGLWKKITLANFITAISSALSTIYVSISDLFLTNRNRGFYAQKPTTDIILEYDSAARTITMTGPDVRATYEGKLVTDTDPTFITGWVSPAHPILDIFYVLTFDGVDIDWRTSFNISEVLIAIKPKGFPACIRECHPRGVSVEDHTYNHYGEGTIFQSGGSTSNIVIDSFTAAERRPYIADTYINDDGLLTLLPQLATNSYTRFYLSGTETTNYDLAQIDIIEVGANNRPYYYDISSGTWVKTLIPRITTGTSASRQRYCSVWVLGIPVTADASSQEYRFIFIQPQGFSTSLDAEKAKNPAEVLFGLLGTNVPEMVIFTQYIIRYKPDEGTGDWNIAAVVAIRGSKARPVVAAPNSEDILNGFSILFDDLMGLYFTSAGSDATIDYTPSIQVRTSGTSSNVTQAGCDNAHTGVFEFNTGTDVNGRAYLITAPSIVFTNGEIIIQTEVKIPVLSTSAQRLRTGFGFFGGGYFFFIRCRDDVTSGNWHVWKYDADVSDNNTDTGVAVVANTWYKLKMVVASDGSSVDVYIDDVLVLADQSYNISTTAQGIILDTQNLVGSTAKKVYFDYIFYKKTKP